MANVAVLCQSLSTWDKCPRMESGCGWWGQEPEPSFLLDEDFGDGLLPWQEGCGGEEVRLETCGRAPISPGVLWLPKPPSCSSALCCWFLGVFPQVWVPLCQIQNENEQEPRGNAGLWAGAAPSSPLHHPGTAQGCSGRAQISARSPQNGQGHPQKIPQNRVRWKSHPQTRILSKEQLQGLKAIFPPGKEHGPGSWGSQKVSLSSTLSPTGRPRRLREFGVPCARAGVPVQPRVRCQGPQLCQAEQGMCFGLPEGLTASFHLDV